MLLLPQTKAFRKDDYGEDINQGRKPESAEKNKTPDTFVPRG